MPNRDQGGVFDLRDRSMRADLAFDEHFKRKRRKEKLGVEETRKQAEFEWKEEDREKNKDYDVMKSELNLGNALVDAGKIREGAARYVNAYNKKWPDGKKAMVSFRSDKPDTQSMAEWDSKPSMAGNEIALLLEKGGLIGFKSIKEFKKFTNAIMGPKEYLKASKASKANIAKMNAQEKPFRAKDGYSYVQTWEMDSGGNPKRGPQVPYKGETAASKQERLGMEIEESGITLTPAEEKQVRLGLKPSKKEKAVAPGKKLDQYKKSLDLVMRLFKGTKSGSMFDDEGNYTQSGQNSLDSALKLIEKAENNPEKLTSGEKKKLPHAKRAWDMFSKISEAVSAEYKQKEGSGGGGDWRSYRQGASRTKLPPEEAGRPQLGGRPPTLPRQSATAIPPSY